MPDKSALCYIMSKLWPSYLSGGKFAFFNKNLLSIKKKKKYMKKDSVESFPNYISVSDMVKWGILTEMKDKMMIHSFP